MQVPEIIGFTCVLAFSLAGMVCDWKMRKLPNVLTVPAFVVGLLFQAVAGLGIVFALKGFAVGFGILLILWLAGGSGGGDVKFMGALGTWLGAWLTFQVLVLSAVLSGIITIAILGRKTFQLLRQKRDKRGAASQRSGKKKADSKSEQPWWRSRENWIVPYGVPVALATWILIGLNWAGYVLPWPIPMR